MITQGLIIAGWQEEAIAWINALGSSGVPLELKQFWGGFSPHPTDPDLDLNAISVQMVLHPASDLQRKAHQANRNITEAWIQALPERLKPRPGPRRRWLLCASPELKQCWLYRVEQKRQQLEALGCSARLLSANELQQETNPDTLLEQIDGLLIHRLPASQSLFGLIAQARRQGIPVVVDLDDLLFDPEHAPPPLGNYAGSIPPEVHRWFHATQPQIQATLRVADHLLFSTAELAERWTTLERQAGRSVAPLQVWPNLIPDDLRRIQRRPPPAPLPRRPLRQRRGRLRLVVASASQPHLLVWHQQLAPALAQLMNQHRHLRLDLLGSLPLPLVLEPFQARIRCRGHCDYPTYLQRLGEADIGLMVLEPGPFTDAKSTNRWMECSLMGLATVLSPIRSCRDLLLNGEHCLFARNQDDWVRQINELIRQPKQRQKLVRQAQQRARSLLGTDQASQLWAPLLRLEDPHPKQRVALVCDHDNPSAIHGEARLANAIAKALRSQPHRVVEWWSGSQTNPEERCRHQWQHRRPDLMHITGVGALSQAAFLVANELKIPCVLHLQQTFWLQADHNHQLHQASCCTANSPRLFAKAVERGMTSTTLLEGPWRALAASPRTPADQPLPMICLLDGHGESGLIALKDAVMRCPEAMLALTVIDSSRPAHHQSIQQWNGCSITWLGAMDRAAFSTLLQSQAAWFEPTLVGGDDPALAKEVLSAGLWMLATDCSAAADVLQAGRNGDVISSTEHSNWNRVLLQLCRQRPEPEPLIHFPRIEPSLTAQLEQLHHRLGLQQAASERAS
mgnify:CR=1 FL=1